MAQDQQVAKSDEIISDKSGQHKIYQLGVMLIALLFFWHMFDPGGRVYFVFVFSILFCIYSLFFGIYPKYCYSICHFDDHDGMAATCVALDVVHQCFELQHTNNIKDICTNHSPNSKKSLYRISLYIWCTRFSTTLHRLSTRHNSLVTNMY